VLPRDHVIALCHGFLGFETIGRLRYFNNIVDNPNMKGNQIIVPEVSMFFYGIEKRAKQLDRQIKLKLKKLDLPPDCTPKIHVIGRFSRILLGFRVSSDTLRSQVTAWEAWMLDD
jgi:hypothetical protein